MEQWTCRVNGNILETPGVDFGRPLEILHRKDNQLVIRCKGSSHWSGIGMPRSYGETEYMRVLLSEETVTAKQSLNGKAYTKQTMTIIERVSPGRKWKFALKTLIDLCEARLGSVK